MRDAMPLHAYDFRHAEREKMTLLPRAQRARLMAITLFRLCCRYYARHAITLTLTCYAAMLAAAMPLRHYERHDAFSLFIRSLIA